MSLDGTLRPTALDELVRRNAAIDARVLEQARKAAEFLRALDLLSTLPATAIRPFTRRRHQLSTPSGATVWGATRDVRFARFP